MPNPNLNEAQRQFLVTMLRGCRDVERGLLAFSQRHHAPDAVASSERMLALIDSTLIALGVGQPAPAPMQKPLDADHGFPLNLD